MYREKREQVDNEGKKRDGRGEEMGWGLGRIGLSRGLMVGEDLTNNHITMQ